MPLAISADHYHKTWEDYKVDIDKIKQSRELQSEQDTIAFARSFCYAVMRKLWDYVDYNKRWKCRHVEFDSNKLDFAAHRLTREIADYFITLNTMEYACLLGNLYTMLLPDSYRSSNGVYYTPPALAERLLDLLAAEGANLAMADILDPACGGGAFLITVANRMLGDYRIKDLDSEAKLSHLESHLAGIEIDNFAGLITQCLLDIIVYQESIKAGRRLRKIVKIQDTILYALQETRKFDVIVGNPPYGRLKLDENTRQAYARSLYGHANLYGLFIDASLRMIKKGGLIGLVTPTSFLGGKYFSNLRYLLSQTLPPLVIDFIALRSGVFEQVLQETCLVVFGQNKMKTVTANKINIDSSTCEIDRIGSFCINVGNKPWVIAREVSESNLVKQVADMENTLEEYGYKVSTGQLVWNRMKNQIKDIWSDGVRPIIWAEAITANNNFSFNYQYRSDKKYIMVSENQEYLICKEPVVLVQRTTAKEQSRRLQACVLPKKFIDQWNGVVVENHVNIVHPVTDHPVISLETLSLLLNSKTVDRIFRCLSGSVAVSATELHAIPLPSVNEARELEEYINANRENMQELELFIMRAYGLEGIENES